MKRNPHLIITVLIVTLVLSACSSNTSNSSDKVAVETGGSEPAKAVSAEPVNLKMWVNLEVSDFDHYTQTLSKFIRAKLPNVTVEFMNSDDFPMKNLIPQKTYPDLIITSPSTLQTNIVDYNMQFDMQDLIKQHNFDLNRIDPQQLNYIKSETGGLLYGIPFIDDGNVMYYDKDIFDHFALPYPVDGMTWDQVYALAVKLTRSEGGQDYRGMGTLYERYLYQNQLSLPLLDAHVEKAAVNTSQWKTVFDNFSRFYKIAGNMPEEQKNNYDFQLYAKGGSHLAMLNANAIQYTAFAEGLNWDMVATPTMAEAPGLAPMGNLPKPIFLNALSEHKDEAFKVIEVLLSDEVQSYQSKAGYGTVLKNEQIKKAYGQDVPMLKGKNTYAKYYNKFADSPPPRDPGLKITAAQARPFLNKAFVSVMNGTDVNTALRAADEGINQMIATELSK
jgi:multiple sugar transport system substrate-binding protein